MAPKKLQKKLKVRSCESEEVEELGEKADWTYELVELLAELMAKYLCISAGQSGAITGKTIEWSKCVFEFQEKSGKPWSYTQLKSKHDNMKINFKLWLRLIHGTTGLGWNNDLNTVDATAEWWRNKIVEDKQFKKFQKEGFGEELAKNLHAVYDISRATGSRAFSTTSRNVLNHPPSTDGYRPLLLKSTSDDVMPNPWAGLAGLNLDDCSDGGGSQSPCYPKSRMNYYGDCSSNLGKRGSGSEESGGSKKTRRLRQYDDSITAAYSIEDSIRDSTKSRNDLNQVLRNMGESQRALDDFRSRWTLELGLERLSQVPDLDQNSTLYLFAYSLILDDKKREAFLRWETVDMAWTWVQFEFHQTMNKNMSEPPNFYQRLMTDKELFFNFIRVVTEMMDKEDEVIERGALLAVKLLHLPPPRTPNHSGRCEGRNWIYDLLNSPRETRIFNAFRMKKRTFCMLCDILKRDYGLKEDTDVTIREKVGIFLHVLSKKQSNRDTAERFGRSGWTVSHYFHQVLDSMDRFGADIVRPRDHNFTEVPRQMQGNPKYMCFKNAVGALDGSHIKVIVDEEISMACRGRKRETSMNVLAVCDFDLLFTFVVSGWEGSAHDAHVLAEAKRNFNFPHPPPGKFYLGDKGYANRGGIVTPFSSVRYHSSQFRGAAPQGRREIYNRWHSSLRSTIERAFGVLKQRWHILECVPHYSPTDQARIVSACFALNNYIRLLDPLDSIFNEYTNKYKEPATAEGVDHAVPLDVEDNGEVSMDSVREEIADAILLT